MAIPESQLEAWSHQGAVTTSKATADSIKNALNAYNNWPEGIDFEVYLQGSYKNDTNIRGDSDVDVVAQLNSTFYSNLSEDQKRTLGLSPASYSWSNFRSDVLKVLKDYYGQSQITEGNKSIKIKANNGRLPADIVVCSQYRRYKTVSSNDFVEGMCFWTRNDDRQVINYPKVHYDNGVSKHQNSSKWYKPVVRLFKNSRGNISGDATPSYFLECMLYNVPNSKFGTSYQDTFCNVVNWLNEINLDNFICQNGQLILFGSTQEQWNTNQAKAFIKNLISLWNNW
ncbi:MAG: tRNA nucleotidyltransferase [Nitrospirae bacterium RBG_13_39_12]|nr:MAG: tRNA nucleotidyltransferase [Nitrospirae bacterium RBG_13_39_12]